MGLHSIRKLSWRKYYLRLIIRGQHPNQISSIGIMKLAIVLLLVGIVTVSCHPKRGKRQPCKANGGIESCICTDESTCVSEDDCKAKCGRKNPIVSCTCADKESWTAPEKGDRPAKKDRPCGKGRNIESCVCADGETYEGKKAVRHNCKKDVNPATECTCKDGSEWPSKEEESEEEE